MYASEVRRRYTDVIKITIFRKSRKKRTSTVLFYVNNDLKNSWHGLGSIPFDPVTKIKSKTIFNAVLALNKLGDNNQVLILDGSQHIAAIWVIKKQTLLPKEELIYTDATLLKLPIPKVTWDVAIRERTKHNIWTKMERRASVPLYEGIEGKNSQCQFITLTVLTLLKWGLHQEFLEIDVLVVSDREG